MNSKVPPARQKPAAFCQSASNTLRAFDVRDVNKLSLHPLQSRIPSPDENSPAWAAFVGSVRQHSIVQPLVITPDAEIMDGGWRWRAAKQVGLQSVPVVVRPKEEAVSLMVSSLLNRKTLTRGAAVYLALGLKPDLVSGAAARRAANLSGKNHRLSELLLCDAANEFGVSARLMDDAVRVFKMFKNKPDLRAKFEPPLLAGECGLGAILKTVCKVNRPIKTKTALDRMARIFTALARCGRAWDNLNRAERGRALQLWRKVIITLPVEFQKPSIS